MAAWVDANFISLMIGTAARTALGLSGSTFTHYENAAQGTVISAMQYAGYTPPDTVDHLTPQGAFLAQLVAGIMIRDAFQFRKGIRLPFDPSGTISEALFRLDALYNKKLPIPGMTPDTLAGYGGNISSPTTGTNARPSYFGPGKLRGF